MKETEIQAGTVAHRELFEKDGILLTGPSPHGDAPCALRKVGINDDGNLKLSRLIVRADTSRSIPSAIPTFDDAAKDQAELKDTKTVNHTAVTVTFALSSITTLGAVGFGIWATLTSAAIGKVGLIAGLTVLSGVVWPVAAVAGIIAVSALIYMSNKNGCFDGMKNKLFNQSVADHHEVKTDSHRAFHITSQA